MNHYKNQFFRVLYHMTFHNLNQLWLVIKKKNKSHITVCNDLDTVMRICRGPLISFPVVPIFCHFSNVFILPYLNRNALWEQRKLIIVLRNPKEDTKRSPPGVIMETDVRSFPGIIPFCSRNVMLTNSSITTYMRDYNMLITL